MAAGSSGRPYSGSSLSVSTLASGDQPLPDCAGLSPSTPASTTGPSMNATVFGRSGNGSLVSPCGRLSLTVSSAHMRRSTAYDDGLLAQFCSPRLTVSVGAPLIHHGRRNLIANSRGGL